MRRLQILTFVCSVIPAICTQVAGQQPTPTRYFKSIKEITAHHLRSISLDGTAGLDATKLRVKELDLNGDKKTDYWLLHEQQECGSAGCFGSSYLWTPQGFCEGAIVREELILTNRLPRNRCGGYAKIE